MALIDSIEIVSGSNVRRIELHKGDLTALPDEERTDLLVVSAFPDDYLPTSGSLIGALHRKGISVEELASNKEVDLRECFSCWLSWPIGEAESTFHFRRIMCFEPGSRGTPPEVIGDVFRALAPFMYGDTAVRSVSMPILATGDQGWSIRQMLSSLVSACAEWMRIGFPLEVLRIYIKSHVSTATVLHEFAKLKAEFQSEIVQSKRFEYDVFVSYSRKDEDVGPRIADLLIKENRKVYIDVLTLEHGLAWQPHIYSAIENCQKVVAIYSPNYLNSKVCQEEFNIAWARQREEDESRIFPIYWRTANLPIYMRMLNYFDCRESQSSALEAASQSLVRSLY